MIDKIRIVDMKEEQVQAVFVLSCDNFTTPWSYKSIYDELENKQAKTLIAIDEKSNVVGFLNVHHILDEGDINNIAVNKDCRNQGIGKKLMISMFEYAKLNNINTYMLEVRESNISAISFYKSLGFEQVGMRKNYYTKPTENALLFNWSR